MRASARVEALLAELSLDEKASLTIGSGAWHTAALPERGVGRVKVTDGPTGARGDGRSGARATCFPVGVCLGASWSPDLLDEGGGPPRPCARRPFRVPAPGQPTTLVGSW